MKFLKNYLKEKLGVFAFRRTKQNLIIFQEVSDQAKVVDSFIGGA